MRTLLLLVLIISLSACTSVEKRIAESEPYSSQIAWPAEFAPSKADFYVHNKIEIDAPAEIIWDVLIEAESWPEWYVGAKNVEITNSESTRLEADTVFTWKTMGLNFESEITEFKKPTRLSWVSRKSLIKGYHAWLLVPQGENRTVLVTDESQHGFLANLQSIFQRNKLRNLHDQWLLEIKERAEARYTAQVG